MNISLEEKKNPNLRATYSNLNTHYHNSGTRLDPVSVKPAGSSPFYFTDASV